MKLNNFSIVLVVSLFLASCGTPTTTKEEGNPIARTGKYYLYPSDIEGIGKDMSPKDSLYQLDVFVQQWIRDKLMLQVAETSVEVTQRMEQLQESYRASLVMTAYEEQLVKDKMDTKVTNEQLLDYYAANKEQYQAGISWVQCYFVKVKRSVEGVQELRQWFKSEKEADFEKIKLFCAKNNTVHILNKERWTKYEKVKRELPKGAVSDRHKKGTSILNKSDDDFVYLMKIFEYRDKEDTAPLPKVKDQITRIILHLRHNEILQSIRRQVYEEGKANSDFEIY